MSAPTGSHQAAPPEKPSFWDGDWSKAAILLGVIFAAVAASIAFIESRVDGSIDSKLEPVTVQVDDAREQLTYVRQRLDQNAEDMGALKADMVTVKDGISKLDSDIADIKATLTRIEKNQAN